VKWRLVITPRVQVELRILPPQTKQYIRQAFLAISQDPRNGKPLRDELTGLHSFRAKRFRVVYRIQRQTVSVVVVGVGPRETIYQELTARFHSGVLE